MAKERKTAGRGRATKPAAAAGRLPSRDDILKFIAESPGKVGKREIARAFGIKGGERIQLKGLIADMTAEGDLVGNRKAVRQKGPPT